jgi:hypothetical protein
MGSDLEARLAKLEKSNRRWKLAALIAGGLLSAGVLMGQRIQIGGAGGGITAPLINCDKVNTKNIVINDGAGTERASLALDGNDNVVLALKEKNGVTTMEIRANSDGGGAVKVTTVKGKTLAIIGADGKDQPGILLKDAEGKNLFNAP